jgi:hypothetical protein
LANSLNTFDLNGRFAEGNSFEINRDSEGLVISITTTLPNSVIKTFSFSRNIEGFVDSVNIQNSDLSYNKTYTFVRDSEGLVTEITIS